MGLDYYAILNITRSATDADIKKAYRKLAHKTHPAKNPTDPFSAEKFSQVAEAYEVLVDPRKRAVYDQFGEEGLKQGVPQGSGQAGAWTQGWTFHGDPHKVFYEFFGGDNPFQEFYDRADGDLSMGFGGLAGRGKKKQDPPIEQDLYVSLEEVFFGCVKKVKISRRVMNEDGHTSSVRDKILTVEVKPGWPAGTAISFEREGDQGPNTVPADIVFVLRDKPHARFRREGPHLVHVAHIPLHAALAGCTLDVDTLDDRLIHVPIVEIVKPGYVKVVPGEGMPLPEDTKRRGDLIIEFDVEFPQRLSREQKILVTQALTSTGPAFQRPAARARQQQGADDENDD